MTSEDAKRWNLRYRAGWTGAEPQPRNLLKQAFPFLAPGGLILDIAMGLGANAHWLLQNGFSVAGIDISSTAVFDAKQKDPRIMAVIGDLDDFIFPENSFSGVLNFYYLNRRLLKDLPRILKPGGIAVMETLTIGMLEIKPDLPEDFLLQTEELPDLFFGWNILFYREGWQPSDHGGRKSVASLIAQVPH